MPDGYLILFSSFDYFCKLLMISTREFFKKRNYNQVFASQGKFSSSQMTKCCSCLVYDMEIMLARAEQLEQSKMNHLVDNWIESAEEWKTAGLFSGVWENMKTFVNKKSIVIDDSVFLISNSVSEIDRSGTQLGNCPKSSFASLQGDLLPEKSKVYIRDYKMKYIQVNCQSKRSNPATPTVSR